MPAEKFEVGLVFKAFDKVTGPLKQINSSLKGLKIQEFNRTFASFKKLSGITQIHGAFKEVGSSMRNVGSQLSSLATRFTIFAGVASAAIFKLVHSTNEWASQIHDLSLATGASQKSIQSLGFALRQAGGSPQDFEAGLKKFSVALAQARKGTGPLIKVMKQIDPKGLNEILKSKDTGTGLRLFIQSLSKAKSDPARFSASLKILGKTAAASFAVLAKEGPEALAKIESSIPLFGEDQINNMEAFGDTAESFFERLKLIARSFVIESAPALTAFFEGLSDSLGLQNEEFREAARKFGSDLPKRLDDLTIALKNLWDAFQPVLKFLKWLAEDAERLKVAFVVLAGVISAPFIASIAGAIGALGSLAASFLGTPVGLFALAIAALGLQIYLMYQQAKPVAKILGGMFDDAIASGKAFYETLLALGDLVAFGPLKRFFNGEDSEFQPFKKFKDITFPEPSKNTKNAWDDAVKEREQDSAWIKDIMGWNGSLKSNSIPQAITRDSEITIRFENAPAGLKANVTRNEGNKIKVDLPLGLQTVGRPA